MKKLTALVLVCIMMLAVAAPVFASELKIEDEINQTKSYYTNIKKELTDWQETLICAATGANVTYTAVPELGENASAADYAKAILTQLALNQKPDDTQIQTLVQMQQEDGSFRHEIYSTMICVEALQAVSATYESGKATDYLLSQQQEDGGFAFPGATSGDVDTTAMAVTALSVFIADGKVADAIGNAVKFLQDKQLENGGFSANGKENANSTATVIMALVDIGQNPESEEWNYMVSSLLRFQNDDGSFRYTEDTETNDLATVQAFMALESVRYGASVYKTLATNGTFHAKIDWEGLCPLFIVFGVFCVFSIVFWIFIFLHKPRSKTLEETKLDPELLPKLEDDEKEE